MSSAKKRVFISYAHDDKLKVEVGKLVAWLNKQEGIEATSDHLHSKTPPKEGWQTWMLRNMSQPS